MYSLKVYNGESNDLDKFSTEEMIRDRVPAPV